MTIRSHTLFRYQALGCQVVIRQRLAGDSPLINVAELYPATCQIGAKLRQSSSTKARSIAQCWISCQGCQVLLP